MPRPLIRRILKAPEVRIPFNQKLSMVLDYARGKLTDQIKAVAFLVLYLAIFQTLILRQPIANALVVCLGIGAVIVGLAFFLEGLFLGVMPLAERCGLRLPARTKLTVIVVFALALGMTATFAEPALGFLRAQGSAVRPWNAPLLYLLLNRGSTWLLMAIATGVGMAVILGVFRYIKGWTLRPFIFLVMPILLGLSAWAAATPTLASVVGLAWDAGYATTGPVTVPIVIALGIGLSRISGQGDSASGGLGVVTMAAAMPVLTVFLLAFALGPRIPAPGSPASFFAPEVREKASFVVGSEEELRRLAAETLSPEEYAQGFEAVETVDESVAADDAPPPVLSKPASFLNGAFWTHLTSALKSILPLALVLLGTLRLLLGERIENGNEIFLGLVFSVIGMFLFNLGMESGLSVLGREAGRSLPMAYTATARPDRVRTYTDVDESLLVRVLGEGGVREYLPVEGKSGPELLPFDRDHFDPGTGSYTYLPVERPILADAPKWAGYAAVLLFVFVMGFGATLAEPSLSALGTTLEEMTTGTYKRSFLVRTVAIGVGCGLMAGFGRIILDLPLIFVLGIPFLLALALSAFSSDEFVSIAWDSAGVTTGPITVPLVIAAGLGIGDRSGALESFGVVASAAVFTILAVLVSGLLVNLKKRRTLAIYSEEL